MGSQSTKYYCKRFRCTVGKKDPDFVRMDFVGIARPDEFARLIPRFPAGASQRAMSFSGSWGGQQWDLPDVNEDREEETEVGLSYTVWRRVSNSSSYFVRVSYVNAVFHSPPPINSAVDALSQ